ncbi:hypothetical protein [Fusibacter sp. JL216-2]|uniref:hypothetical protein n=1 Tax=Fusibacter sp. JL216-2 TaxID=3071453 RepID=UPI003D3598FD
MKNIFSDGSNWLYVVMGVAILSIGVMAFPKIMNMVNAGNGQLAYAEESQQSLEYSGFETGANRQGYEVIGLIKQIKNSNAPRMRVVVTTRSGETTTYGYASPTSDTYVAYDINDPSDDDYIVESDNYEITEIRTGPNDVLEGFTAEEYH